MKLVSLLSGNGFVLFNKELAHEVSVNGAIIFGQLCSSFESFGSKGMLTIRDGKEYSFLTSEVIEEETALSYKQQSKAIKDLEEAGYIESVIMGSPAKKYFHITDKIIQQLQPKDNGSFDKREELKEEEEQENSATEQSTDFFSFDKSENQAYNKGQSKPVQKGQAYKNKNQKEQNKNNKFNFNCNYKVPMTIDKFKVLLTDACNEFYTTYSVGRYSKKQWNTLIEKFVNDSIERGYYQTVPEHKIKGFAYKSLGIIVDNTDYKRSDEYAAYLEVMRELKSNTTRTNFPTGSDIPFYNWLEQ